MATANSPARETDAGKSREAELLLCCARTRMDESDGIRAGELLRRDLKWDYIVAAALQHRVATLLYWNLRTRSENVPRHVLDTLANWCQEMTERNELMAVELAELLRELQTGGVDAIPFKGPVLAIGAYGNLSLRTFSDLDLIVRRRDIAAATEVLLSRNYRPIGRKIADAPGEGQPYRVFQRVDGKVKVDLQSSIEDANFSFSLDRAEWSRERESVTYHQLTFPTLAPDVTLLVLCVHGCKHLWERLIWIADVAEMVRSHPDLDWERLGKRARLLRVRRMLDTGLAMAGGLLGENSARAATLRLGTDWDVESLAARLSARVFREATTRTSAVARAAFYLRMEDRWQDRLRYALHISIELSPDREMWSVLPIPLVLLCCTMQSLRFLGRLVIRAQPLVRLKHKALHWIERTR